MVDEAVVGQLGSVVRTVRGGTLPGEIRVIVAGEAQLYIAFCADTLDVGTRVRVVKRRGSRQVDVEAWPQITQR